MGTWMLTNPFSTVRWHDNLAKIAALGDNIENIEAIQNQLTDGKFMSMKISILNSFSFKDAS